MNRSARRGMTLIELLVVIAIIAILAGLVLPAILQARGASRKAQCQANLKQLAQAVQTFHNRMDCLPVYWGAMKGGGGEKFGGWLLHLLPDLDQQSLYDAIPPAPGTLQTSGSVVQTITTYKKTGRRLPAIPPSPDWSPGGWVQETAKDALGNSYPIMVLKAAKGDPGLPERDEMVPVTTTSTTIPVPFVNYAKYGSGTGFAIHTSRASLPVLTDSEDPSPTRAPTNPLSPSLFDNAPLTNYLVNAHVFTAFSGPRIAVTTKTSADPGGLFPAPKYAPNPGTPPSPGNWSHAFSGTSGPVGRRFEHVTDGLTNVLLAAEGMRQCDALQTYRYAFLSSGPSGTTAPFNEHSFGIMPTLRTGSGNTVSITPVTAPSYGNTLMFQTRPSLQECNTTRVQALHGEFLMTAMCDGSVRPISSYVQRREPVGANACGRLNFGTNFFGWEARGADQPDGVWDMLMQPADGGLLANTGEIGREQ